MKKRAKKGEENKVIPKECTNYTDNNFRETDFHLLAMEVD